MLPSTITLNVGSPAADVVYDDVYNGVLSKIYYAESPQGDLEGRPSIEFMHSGSDNGIMRGVAKIRRPLFDVERGVYDGFISTNIPLIRPRRASVTDVQVELEKAAKLLAISDVVNAMVKGLL